MDTETVTVNGDATYTTAGGTKTGSAVPTVAGAYQWVAVYNCGDGNNIPASAQRPGAAEQETVTGPASPSISTTPQANQQTTQCSQLDGTPDG